MKTPPLTTFAVGALCVALGCTNSEPTAPLTVPRASFAAVPADGNGNKQIVAVDFTDAVSCPDGTDLTRHVTGWVQERVFNQDGNRHLVLDVTHIDFIFTNSTGQSYVWPEVGPDLFWIENGDLMAASVGRVGGVVIGLFKRNLTTGELVLLAGKEVPPRFILACEALT
jgi:hypothetical protein